MSLSISQQYYLQAMGIDLYVLRDEPNESDKANEASLANVSWNNDLALALKVNADQLVSTLQAIDGVNESLLSGPTAKKQLWQRICSDLESRDD